MKTLKIVLDKPSNSSGIDVVLTCSDGEQMKFEVRGYFGVKLAAKLDWLLTVK